MTPHPRPDAYTLAAQWFLFSGWLIAFARQISALEKTGARGAVRKAELLDVYAQAILFDVLRLQAEARGLPESPQKDALMRQLAVTAYAMVGLRLVAWNFRHGRAARAEVIGAMAADYSISPMQLPQEISYAPTFVDTS